MKKLIKQRREFNKAFEIHSNQAPSLVPHPVYHNEFKMMNEETEEYLTACAKRDIYEIADAIGDQMYLVLSQAARHGLLDCLEEIVDEIHKSNMSKLGPKGEIIKNEDGKVQKPETYFKPNIKRIIDNHIKKFEMKQKLYSNED